jgi:hypothetical protein
MLVIKLVMQWRGRRKVTDLLSSCHHKTQITCWISVLMSLLWDVFYQWEEFQSSAVLWGRKCRVLTLSKGNEFEAYRHIYTIRIYINWSYGRLNLSVLLRFRTHCGSHKLLLCVNCKCSGIFMTLWREKVTKNCFRFCSWEWVMIICETLHYACTLFSIWERWTNKCDIEAISLLSRMITATDKSIFENAFEIICAVELNGATLKVFRTARVALIESQTFSIGLCTNGWLLSWCVVRTTLLMWNCEIHKNWVHKHVICRNTFRSVKLGWIPGRGHAYFTFVISSYQRLRLPNVLSGWYRRIFLRIGGQSWHFTSMFPRSGMRGA